MSNLDFLIVSQRAGKNGTIEISPKFIVKKSQDLMIRGSDFYAIWDEENGIWSKDENRAFAIIDSMTKSKVDDISKNQMYSANIVPKYLWDTDSGVVDKWHKYVQKQLPDNWHQLDEKIIFANSPVDKNDYATKRLNYNLESGDISSYQKLMNVLYSPEEQRKIEWAIGAIISGDSKKIQKFLVLYGSAGTGKSTVLNIIQGMFDGYYTSFNAKSIGSTNNSFALESFKDNPLIAIQHDGDLSRIEDNSRLNSLISHEYMSVNEKFKSAYSAKFNSFLLMGTNKPVRITDAKSGIIRRLIDVKPTGHKIPYRTYTELMNQIKFEYGAIAKHCLDIYEEDPTYYNNYIPVEMIGATNDFYNFVEEYYDNFKEEHDTTLSTAWSRYKQYCQDANIPYPMTKRAFKEELKNYYSEFKEHSKNGSNVYIGFNTKPFEAEQKQNDISSWIKFSKHEHSPFDSTYGDCFAQYATENGTPEKRWSSVRTKLCELNPWKLHYVRVPENLIVIDFDIRGDDGNKSFEKNLAEATNFPPTYAELSKSGQGIHLHYIYDGDPTILSNVYGPNVEVKVFTGNSSLRRKLTMCNDIPIAHMKSGSLPIKEKKGDSSMINDKVVKSEKNLRNLIVRNLRKEIHPGTKPSVDFIKKILDDAYTSGLHYDVSDMEPDILAFANGSTHHSQYCVGQVAKMKFKSEEPAAPVEFEKNDIVFFDVEVFPNLLVVDWKKQGTPMHKKSVHRMINPSSEDISMLCRSKLVGFNNRNYDNSILYARILGYSNEQIYNLSQRLITEKYFRPFTEANNLSYTDIYDFSSKKQSLKKFEIELDIHHQELGLPWDQPVKEELWDKVADYCANDVLATEETFNARKDDFLARQMLVKLANALCKRRTFTVNDKTNTLTGAIIFRGERNPQSQFVYTDLSKMFPGYKYDKITQTSTYMDEVVGEGGYVYSEPGIYKDVALLDIASMHPHSIIALNAFGPYTKNFKDLLDLRIAVKHHEYAEAKTMMDGALSDYISEDMSDEDAKTLSKALKIAINSVYGLTSAKFDNPFKDPRNVDNIVAKRGALFMMTLKKKVQEMGYTVAHIKTDSIKIPNADQKIIDFVTKFGKQYGYDFEHEATFERFCLVNDAVYICKVKEGDENGAGPGEWSATGAQFQQPYVFKTLFAHEPIEFKDMCEVKSVSGNSALYLDMNEALPADQHNMIFVGKVGEFCPIKEGCGGGVLLRNSGEKYTSVVGTKGYRWLESESVKGIKEECIDISYYRKECDDAIDTINKFGSFEKFVSEKPEEDDILDITSDELPF